ncbi:MAG TPA: hypothetical protein VNL71_25825, partial [Chloroflexota bacterium]|nr:hypothetical protein [Chloroflexota bacterium]
MSGLGPRGRPLRAALLFTVALALAALLLGVGRSASLVSGVQIRFAGQRQIVFNWRAQACEPNQVADLPARAFRDDRGRTQLLLSHFDNFRMIGPSLDRLHVDCGPVMVSADNSNPAAYRDREWIASPYTEDGRHIWALVHDEYQGNRHPGKCPQGSYYRCWYNAITLAKSNNAGRSFRPIPAPKGLIASAPYPYQPGIGPAGVFAPSNLIKRGDGYLYALVQVHRPGTPHGACLIRSPRIADAGSWRAWNGGGFGGVFTDPYRSPAHSGTDCEFIALREIADMTESLTFNTELKRYLLVGMAPSAEPTTGRYGTGIYYSVSKDLIHWSQRRLLLEAPTIHSYRCGGPSPIAYPSVIDPSSHSPTFAT